MLVSFRKQFIYTKTVRTAGTSVEVFFEAYCMPDSEYRFLRHREASITDYGIIGCRGPNIPSDAIWYNHMPAARIKELLGAEKWNGYLKFCTVRNPFDKLVSWYIFRLGTEKRKFFRDKNMDFNCIRSDFLNSFKTENMIMDRDRYFMNGKLCIDFFIRFENIKNDIKKLCEILNIERNASDLPRLQASKRFVDNHFSEYYDKAAIGCVERAFRWEIERFGYSLER